MVETKRELDYWNKEVLRKILDGIYKNHSDDFFSGFELSRINDKKD